MEQVKNYCLLGKKGLGDLLFWKDKGTKKDES